MASSDQAAGKAEAPKTLRKRLAEVFHRKSEAPEKVTFTDYADRYVEERELSEVYSDTLKRRAKQLQVFFRQPLYLDDLTEDLVN